MSDTAALAHQTGFKVTINAQEVDAGKITRLETCAALNQPSWANITFHDPGDPSGAASLADQYEIGKPVKLTAQVRDETEQVLFDGEITGLEYEVESGTTFFTVTAHDKLHRLFHANTFKAGKDMKHSDAMSAALQGADMSVTVDATDDTFEYLPQTWATDGDLVVALAAANGMVVQTHDGGVKVAKPDFDASEVATLLYGQDVLRFRASQTARNAADKVTVRGWNVKDKEVVVASSPTIETKGIPSASDPSKALSSAMDTSANVVGGAAYIQTDSVATAAAKAMADIIGDAGGAAEGLVLGRPEMRPGVAVKVEGMPAKFCGKYYLSEVRHLLIDGEYHTEFRCTGRLSGLGLGGGHDRSDPAGLGLGALQQRGLTMLPAIVTANREHPDGIEGMVKVKIPLIDDAEDIGWMRVVTPGAGANATVTFMPEIDDEVLVAFADGDIRTGYVLGGLYNGKDKPLEELASPVPGSVNLRGIRTPVGHYLVFDEDGNTVTLSDSNQSMLLLDASAETITLQGASGSFEINTSSGDITINAPGDMIFKSDKGVTIEAGMALTLKAGTDFKAEGGTNAELKAGVGVTVKGTTAELNGSATTTVKGAMVMIN